MGNIRYTSLSYSCYGAGKKSECPVSKVVVHPRAYRVAHAVCGRVAASRMRRFSPHGSVHARVREALGEVLSARRWIVAVRRDVGVHSRAVALANRSCVAVRAPSMSAHEKGCNVLQRLMRYRSSIITTIKKPLTLCFNAWQSHLIR